MKTKPTLCYRNLQRGLQTWSIQQYIDGRYIVVGHADSVSMTDITVKQSIKGRDRARRNAVRNVHCQAVGQLLSADNFTPLKGRPLVIQTDTYCGPACTLRLTYNPFTDATLLYKDGGDEFVSAAGAYFAPDAAMYVSK